MSADEFHHALLRLRLTDLQLVQKIISQGSLAAAAQSLHITQSAATKRLHVLETAVGGECFSRANRGLQLTDAGKLVVNYADHVLAATKSLEQNLLDERRGNLGRVAVGALIAAAPVLLPSTLRQLSKSHPDLQIEITEGTNDILRPRLRNGELDIIVGRISPTVSNNDIRQTVLLEDTIIICAHRSHDLAKRKATPKMLAACNWILPPPDTLLRPQLDQSFLAAGITPPSPAVESVALSTNLSLLTAGEHLLALPAQVFTAHKNAYGLVTIRTDLRLPTSHLGYEQRRETLSRPAVEIFISSLHAAAAGCRKRQSKKRPNL